MITRPGITKEASRFGIVKRKSAILSNPQLYLEEEKYLPFIIRGIIDGDGCVSKTSYGGAQFYICSLSEKFINWVESILTDRFFMDDIHKR